MLIHVNEYKKETLKRRLFRQKVKLLKATKILGVVVVLSALSLVSSVMLGDGTLAMKLWMLTSQIIVIGETALLSCFCALLYLTDELNISDVCGERLSVDKDTLECRSNTYYRLLNENISLPIANIRQAILDEEKGECTFLGEFEYTYKDSGVTSGFARKKIKQYTMYDCFDCDMEKVLLSLNIPCRIIRREPTKIDNAKEWVKENVVKRLKNKDDLASEVEHQEDIEKALEGIAEEIDTTPLIVEEKNGVVTGKLPVSEILEAEQLNKKVDTEVISSETKKVKEMLGC